MKQKLVWRVELSDERGRLWSVEHVIAEHVAAAAKKAEDAENPVNDGLGHVYTIRASKVELVAKARA